MLDENEIIEAVLRYLEGKGWNITQALNTTEKGVDIIAHNNEGDTILIEAKGATSSREGSARFGKPYLRSQIFDRVSKGLYATVCLRGEHKGNKKIKVFLALPDAPVFREFVSKIEESLVTLDIKIFWVEELGMAKEGP